ncbi:MAG: hypothetical protein AB7Q42_20670 [Acidimicrobiia bacterium]
MSFGQSAPSASAKQIAYLLSLVKQAGHDGFRDARGPLGLTQRQAAGKFSKAEASTLIDLLVNGTEGGPDEGPPAAINGERISATDRLALDRADLLRGMPAELLAGELERRGWSVTAP